MEKQEEVKESAVSTKEVQPDQHESWLLKILAAIGVVALVFLLVGLISAAVLRVRGGGMLLGRPYAMNISVAGGRGGIGRFGAGGVVGTNEQRLSGVVTAVGSSSVTIAGGGTTNTMQTNSSTQYNGGTKPVVNDTITALGTTNNGTFTATEVIVQ